MSAWQQWVHRPQGLWVRRALVQIHLWVGIGAAIYVLLVSISGSAIVLRRELGRTFSRRVTVVPASTPRMNMEDLQGRVQRSHPGYEVYNVLESERPDRPDQVVLGNGKRRISRLIDPYTGADLGNTQSLVNRALGWMTDLHDNLLTGRNGRTANGIGGFLLTVMSLTGIVIWWPGIKNWRRSLTVKTDARFARFNWDLHSATGFWCSVMVFVWGISGFALCFPGVLNYYLPSDVMRWITQLHFGRFNGVTELLWTMLGLAPAVLAVTGSLMWWNRVLSKKLGQTRH